MDEIIRVFGINWKLLAIQAVNFGLLLILLHRFLYKPLLKVIEERQMHIKKGVENAALAEQKLGEAEGQKRVILSDATGVAEAVIRKAEARATEIAEHIKKEAEESAGKIVARGVVRGEEEAKRLKENSKEEIARMAVLTAEKILRETAKA
ncbi:MAG: F0F1 ATP synthase subunit B [Patescibacteria group bacterium]